MPKHSILERVHSNIRVPRNGFDLSYRRLFTADAGELLPIYVEHCNPNEHFRINPNCFIRTATLNTAAYTRLKQNIEFFFVPYRLLLSTLPQKLVATDFNISSTFKKTLNQSLPWIRIGNIGNGGDPAGTYPMNCLGDIQKGNPLVTGTTANNLTSIKDIFGFNMTDKSSKLLQLLGYGSAVNGTEHYDGATFGCNTLNLQAYLKIYNDFYRNPLLESDFYNCYNLDGYVNDLNNQLSGGNVYNNEIPASLFVEDGSHQRYRDLITLRYRNYKKDLITHLRPDFAGADFLNTQLSSPQLYTPIDLNTNSIDVLGPVNTNNQGTMDTISLVGDQHSETLFSINNLRSAYALDKLLFITSNAKDGSYNEQIKAHFGFDPHLDNQKVQFIGSVDAPITISDVDATSTTDSSTLGQIAGKGVSLSNGGFEFDTREHGIIMGIFSIVPEVDYPDYGVDPMLLKTSASDFYKPEFGDLGYQPLTMSILQSTNLTKDVTSATHILGYTNRYAEYKSRIDKVDGEFLGDLNAWVTTRNIADYKTQLENGISNTFQKINPSYLNNIFAIRADGKHNQFLCNAFFNVQAIRPMSIYGVPYSNI